MTEYIWTTPVARKRHRCQMCGRIILPGETYGRMAGLDGGTAWTYKCCPHCIRIASAWDRAMGGRDEWDDESIFEWLSDEHPAVWASLVAGWRYPDGDLLPLPFQPRCIDCGDLLGEWRLWCPSCDERRVERINRQFIAIEEAVQ